MGKYRVIVSKHVADYLLTYIEFISLVSTEAARQFIAEYEKIIVFIAVIIDNYFHK